MDLGLHDKRALVLGLEEPQCGLESDYQPRIGEESKENDLHDANDLHCVPPGLPLGDERTM